MIINNVKLEITRDQYYKIESHVGGRSYGNYKGLNVVLYRNISGGYYMKLADHVDTVKK